MTARAARAGASAIAIAIALAACGKRDAAPPRGAASDADARPTGAGPTPGAAGDAATAAPEPAAGGCTRETFAESIPLPEASGTARLDIDGKPALLVVADSGNNGAYVIVDPATGAVRESGDLPLGDGANDDVEGLAATGGKIYGITSGGWIRVWRRARGGFELVDGPYPVAPTNEADPLACKGARVNCGKDYEGLCLRIDAIGEDECAGLAASKADGALYCLVFDGDKLAAQRRSIAVTERGRLSGCDIADDGAAWAGNNLFGRSLVYRITDWTTPTQALVREVAAVGDGFPESITVGPGNVVYRFSDLGGAPSAVAKFRCSGGGR